MTHPTTWLPGLDYGPRQGTLGWNLHMAEGGDGTAQWLAQRPGEAMKTWRERVNGVSANFVIKSTGNRVQMVGWHNAAGNLNPNDRQTKIKPFYSSLFLKEVLPATNQWTNPNAWTLSVEFTGFRAEGLTDDQVNSFIELNEQARDIFPTMRGAFGHADQTDTKGCPGTHPNTLRLWDIIGHGLYSTQEDNTMMVRFARVSNVGGTITTIRETAGIPIKGGDRPPIAAGMTRPVLGTAKLLDLNDRLCYLMWVGEQLCFVNASDVTFTPNDGPNTNTGITQEQFDAAKAQTKAQTKDQAISAAVNAIEAL